MQQTQTVFPPRYLLYAHHITSLQTLLPYLVGSHGCRKTGHCTFPITIVMQSAPCSSRNSSDGLATADFIHSLLQQTKGASAFKFFSRCLLLSAGYILLLCIKIVYTATRNPKLRKNRREYNIATSHFKFYFMCPFQTFISVCKKKTQQIL